MQKTTAPQDDTTTTEELRRKVARLRAQSHDAAEEAGKAEMRYGPKSLEARSARAASAVLLASRNAAVAALDYRLKGVVSDGDGP
jgi:hypothetical protein